MSTHSSHFDYGFSFSPGAAIDDSSQCIDTMKDGVIEIFTGKKKGIQLGLNGFLYSSDGIKEFKTKPSERHWRCTLKSEKPCPCNARLVTTLEPYTVLREPQHNHEPCLNTIQAARIMTQIRSTALGSNSSGDVVRQVRHAL